MSKFRVGDVVRRLTRNTLNRTKFEVGDTVTVVRLDHTGIYDAAGNWHSDGNIELVALKASIINPLDINELIDQVAMGVIQRGGTQAKFVVSLDGNDVIIRLFGAAKK